MTKKSSSDLEVAVRKSAEKFAHDLTAARAAGLDVTWPARADDLLSLSVSTTAASETHDGEQPAELTPAPGARSALESQAKG